MSSVNKMHSQGGKPSGWVGLLIGRLMNLLHGSIYKWALERVSVSDDSVILDIGCGGGKVVKLLSNRAFKGKVYGLDHSPEMVRLSQKTNRSSIAKGIVDIKQGSVIRLPYTDEHFNLVTAFETIQFWPDISSNLTEVRRVLKSSGTFLIANRYPPADSKWSGFLKLKNENDYKEKLNMVGFKDVSIDTSSRKGWILVIARIGKK